MAEAASTPQPFDTDLDVAPLDASAPFLFVYDDRVVLHADASREWAIGELEGVRRGNVCAFSVVRDGTEELVIMAEANRADAPRLTREIAQRIYTDFGLQVADVVISPVGALPKTSSGKHQRRKTRLLYERGDLAQHPVPADG